MKRESKGNLEEMHRRGP